MADSNIDILLGVPKLASRSAAGGAVPSCQRCHYRKKKCDKTRPACSSCTKSESTCVYDVLISEKTHPKFIPQMLADLNAQKNRVRWLETAVEALTGSTVSSLSTDSRIPNIPLTSALPLAPLATYHPIVSLPIPISTTASHNNIAERIVTQLMVAEIGTKGASLPFRASIIQQLGAREEEDQSVNKSNVTGGIDVWPSLALARNFIERHFDTINVWYSVVDRATVEKDLADLYASTAPLLPTAASIQAPDIRVFRLFVIFAGASNLLEMRRPGGTHQHDPTALVAYAMKHFSAVLRTDDFTCLICLCLLAIGAVVDFIRIDPSKIIGIAARFALDLGYHREDSVSGRENEDDRRRLFWSLYCLDRIVSTTLNRTPIIPDEFITVQLPRQINLVIHGDMDATTFFRNTVLLRRLDGIVLNDIYLGQGMADSEEVFARTDNLIDDWYASLGNHKTQPFFELGYHMLLTNLYRPSPLIANTDPIRLSPLRRSATRGIELYRQFHASKTLAENHIHLYNIVVLSVSIIYVLLKSEGSERNLSLSSWRRAALTDIAACDDLIDSFCARGAGAGRFKVAFVSFSADLRDRLRAVNESSASRAGDSWPAAAVPQPLPTYVAPTQPSPVRSLDLNDLAMWDEWMNTNAMATPAFSGDQQQIAQANVDATNDGLEALLNGVGFTDWFNIQNDL